MQRVGNMSELIKSKNRKKNICSTSKNCKIQFLKTKCNKWPKDPKQQ